MANKEYKNVYGLIGYPLGHSFSQDFFNKKFEAENIDAKYVNFEIPSIEEFPELLLANTYLRGLNVTIPYKEKVIPYLDELDEEAAKVGAVNVIRIIRNAKGEIQALKGYNSDIIGFHDSILSMLKPYHKKALILGTGGAAKAVQYVLNKLGLETKCVSRTAGPGKLSYAELTPAIMDEYKVIVNTTPLGMFPNVNKCPDIPYQCVTPEHLAYDLLYNPNTTLFMKKCAERGAATKNGLEMLLMQAFAAWNIWQLKR